MFKKVLIASLLPLTLLACSKNKETAKELDGTWEAVSLEWEGTASKDAGKITDSLGTWSFTSCNTPKENCTGEVEYENGTAEKFEWRIEDKGESFVIGSVNTGTKIEQMGGKWEIITHNEEQFVIASNECGGCKELGRQRYEFRK